MNPTQNQDGYGPDPTHEPSSGTPAFDVTTAFLGLLADQDSFRSWVASAADTASQPVAAAAEDDLAEDDGYVVTVSGLRALGEVPDSTPEVLRGAACYLERYGWIQGAYYDGTSGVFTPPADMVGALAMVCYGGPCEMPSQHFDDPGFLEFEAALLHLDRYTLVHDSRIAYDFNDVPGRRMQDVINVLRKAAATPADELIDALRAIDQQNEPAAAIAKAFTPGGIWAECATWDDPVSSEGDDGRLTNIVDCQFCGAPGGYPYCQGSFNGHLSCADVVAADEADMAAQGGDAE